ncbi:protocadherin Fat 4 [Patella vulgata]|uniref:protocadherin Fat 4 n=1 Tax=Patella vulgata TaxID=6465 RepID=UPI00217FCC0C|nr:protocadherin Fat 4 [Patella vulgata]
MKKNIIFDIILVILTVSQVSAQNFPICKSNGVTLNVSEAEPLDHMVYDLGCTDPDGDKLTYFLESKGNTYKKFKITQTGEIRLAKTLNADFTFKYNLHVTVTDDSASAFSTKVLIGIFVSNVNDNSPVIKDLPTSINLYEDQPIGTKIAKCSVKDKDSKNGALPGQTRVGIIKPYSAGARRWVIDSETCDIYVNTLLDYEKHKMYAIGIIAYDLDPKAPRTVTQSMTINVLDVNDNFPDCINHYKLESIQEDLPTNKDISTLSCTDLDSGQNKLIFFKLSDGNTQAIKEIFEVTINAGQLRLIKQVDYETAPFYEVNIDVYDGGKPSLTTTVIIGVVVTDVDDNIPEWPVDPIQGTVQETEPLGNVLFALTATDRDEPNTPASTIKYGLVTKADPDWFDIDPETGAIFVTSIMNWLVAPSVSFEVYAYSSDKITATNTARVNITLIDKNNVAPTFDQVFYQGNVSEDSEIDTVILTVSATDPENGLNGEVTYSIDSPYFKVNADTGVVSVKQKVDFEQNTVFSLNIKASDKGEPTQSGYAFLLINVIPVNEFTPVINVPDDGISIKEDTEPGTILFNFTATDGDAGFDGEVTFSIVDPLQPFTIEPITGVFRIGSSLDREDKPRWEIIVIARDNPENLLFQKSVTTTVTVILEDVNDNNPICEPLSNVVVKLPHEIGAKLATIDCTDADEGINSEFEYIALSGDPTSTFKVDQNKGDITLIGPPTKTEYTLTLEIQDKGDPKRVVKIVFNIIAELQFNFTNLPATVNISENTALAVQLYNAKACCVFGFIDYQLISGNDNNHVLLDPSSGKIILVNSFDREAKSSFVYNIRATSSDTNSVTNASLTILVEDFNDIVPTFSTSFLYIEVVENLANSTFIISLPAVDGDLAENGELVYSITDSSNLGSHFVIDQVGNLALNKALDAETTSLYTLEILAADKGATSLTGSTTVIIGVRNVNEFMPEIVNVTDGFVLSNVPEDKALGAPVFKLLAEDKDIDTVFTYTITQGNEEQTFVMDGSSGDIYLAKLLDRENIDQYNLTVNVEAQNESVSAVVIVDILDVNDNDPKFDKEAYKSEVTHDDEANKSVLSFVITDADIGRNGDISTIQITDGDPENYFKIVNNTVETNKQVDYFVRRIYSLTLAATDGGNQSRSGFTRVIIEVRPKFKPPQFPTNETDYTVSVVETTVAGTTAFDVSATAAGAKEGNFGTLKYSIRSGNTENKFYISDSDGTIGIGADLDFETTNQYIMIIDARSKENPALSASTTVTVNIVNVNEHAPTFSKAFYSLSVSESVVTPFELIKFNATDLDGEPFGIMSYSLGVTTGSSDFKINRDGMLIVDKKLDYRRQSVYNIPVIAKDIVLEGKALVVIFVEDVNDNAPKFTPGTITVGVAETMPQGQTFYTVKAIDLDTGINGQIMYMLQPTTSEFILDSITGSLIVNTELDRETKDSYSLVIIAVDNATTSAMTGTLSMTVNVTDVNDQFPLFPNPTSEVIVNRGDAPGTTVLTVTATDDDIGENAAIEYEITDGNTDDLFLVGVTTGEIITSSSLSAANNEYTLRITAIDKGIPPLSTTMALTVQINPPIITGSSAQNMSFQENLPPGVVDMVTPRDGHAPTDAVQFKINGGNFGNSFEIDKKTGRISTLVDLDREKYPKYNLKIDISDNNNISYTKQVTIDVLDENDNTPKITTLDTDITVVENTPAGQIVTRFTVTDDDIGNNGEVDLKIADTANAAAKKYFEISGMFLKIKEPLDYEVTKFVPIDIEAVDGGNPMKTSSIQIFVTVIDVSDNTIIESQGEAPLVYITTETSSSSVLGESVITLTSTDLNLDQTSGTLTFASVNSQGIFSINSFGSVTVTKPDLLQPEEIYFFWFVASYDNGVNVTNVLSLLRIDTFNPNRHLVSLESPSTVQELEPFKDELANSLGNIYPLPNVAKAWKIQEYGTTSRRRLLADLRSETLVYGIKAPIPNDIGQFKIKKNFVDSDELATLLRMVPDQHEPTPGLPTSNYPIQSVNVYSIPTPPESSGSSQTFTSSTDGYIVFALLILLLLVILILLLVFCCYKKKKREQRRIGDSVESLVSQDTRQKHVEVKKPEKSGKAKFSGFSAAEFGDDIPTNKTTRRTSQAPSSTYLPSISGNNRGSTSATVLAAQLSPMMTPVQNPQRQPDGLAEPLEQSHKRPKLKPIEKRVLSVPQPVDERKASTIDLSKLGVDDDGQPGGETHIISRRADGPVIHRGKEYDGVGFDAEKHQRYAYNTRTGSTLWEDKGHNFGKGTGVAKGKKKATPMLTVVTEAKTDFRPNLNMNRSIQIVSPDNNNSEFDGVHM